MSDLDFLVQIDRKDEGCTIAEEDDWTLKEVAEHRDKIAGHISANDKAAWVFEDSDTDQIIGMILWRYRNRHQEEFEEWSIFGELNESLFPPDGAFCEIFQLWVAPEYRRRGLATRLKQKVETESLHRRVTMIYTHTEERNTHVLAMNHKLGYREVRRGPIWDEVVRVSLIKHLSGRPPE